MEDKESSPRRAPVRVVVEAVGLLGVITSLAFVGLEIRQNTTAIRASTIQAISDQANDVTMAIATDEHLPRLVAQMFDDEVGAADLTSEDAWRLRLATISGFRRLENVFLQIEAGVLEEEANTRIGFDFYRTRFSREVWAVVRGDFHPGFVRFLDDLLQSD